MKVLACLSAFVLFAPLCHGDTVLLDFTGQYCPPCRQMEPIIAGLEREGYHIERINVELPESKPKMQQYRVDRIPTYIVLNDGQESGRLVGAVPAESLRRLMAAGGQVRNAKSQKPTSVQSNSGGATVKNVSRSDRPSDVGLIQRSVRIVVDDAKSRSFGTGTVIRSVPGETIVLTCAHLFQGVSRQAKTTVEFFGAPDRPKLGGEVLARDQQADVCLVRVVSPQPFPTAQVAGKQAALSNGQPTASVGCDNGADPTVRHMRVTAINRYVGPPTIECSGEPVEGRSGGGLFNESGDVVGVCSARDPADHRGIYSGLAAIHTLLDRNRLNGLYEPNTSAIAVAGYDSNKPVPPVTLPAPNAIGLKVDRDLAVPDEADRAEVVCVIRSLDDPNAPPRVVLLNRATPEFLSVLEKETANQAARPATSMRLPNKPHVTPAGSAAEPATTPATTDLSGWRSAQAGRDRSSKSTSQGTQSAVEESASWQKNWPAGSSSSDGPVHR